MTVISVAENVARVVYKNMGSKAIGAETKILFYIWCFQISLMIRAKEKGGQNAGKEREARKNT